MVVNIDLDIPSETLNINSENKKCAPGFDYSNGSCVPLEVLVEMAKAYNEDFPNDPVRLNNTLETLNPKKYKRHIVKEFNGKLKNICDNQLCWVKQKFTNRMKKELKKVAKKDIFRPPKPEGQFTWLNTFNINDVMNQYKKKYTDFKFMGAVPIDFDELPQLGLKDMNLSDIKDSGISKLGFVFNLDEHYKSGSHWVGLYTNLKQKQVYFFDSYGIEPDRRIRKLMRRLSRHLKNEPSSGKIDARHNKIRHQYKNSECGVYSMNFILRMLKGETFDEITNNITTDSEVNRCRDVYFQ